MCQIGPRLRQSAATMWHSMHFNGECGKGLKSDRPTLGGNGPARIRILEIRKKSEVRTRTRGASIPFFLHWRMAVAAKVRKCRKFNWAEWAVTNRGAGGDGRPTRWTVAWCVQCKSGENGDLSATTLMDNGLREIYARHVADASATNGLSATKPLTGEQELVNTHAHKCRGWGGYPRQAAPRRRGGTEKTKRTEKRRAEAIRKG